MAAFRGINVSPAKHSFGKCDRKVWQTDRQTDGRTDRQTDDGQSDQYVSLCFAGDTKHSTTERPDGQGRFEGRILLHPNTQHLQAISETSMGRQSHAVPDPSFELASGPGVLTNINRDYYEDVYTILNRILLTIWTICAFRVLNPRQPILSQTK